MGLYLRLAVAALLGWVVFGSLEAAPVPGLKPPAQIASYRLSFADDFNSIDLSPNGSGIHTWYQSVWWDSHTPSRSQILVSNSILTLCWKRNQGSFDTSITTFAHDKTNGRTWRYGYFEARMKWDPVYGAWPAFWLIPAQDARGENIYNGVKKTGEIDVFEGLGDQPDKYFGTVHSWVDKQHTNNLPNWYTLPNGFDFSIFHTYAVLWTPGKVTWYLDDHELYSALTPTIVDKQDFFIVLGCQEGVDWKAGSLAGVTAQKLTLSIDWVRVWQK